jgi:uncharacterized iron-regulated membrane protein
VLAVFEAASCATTPLPRVVVIGTLVVATLLPLLAATLALTLVLDRLITARQRAALPTAT